MAGIVTIQASFAGLRDKPCTLFSGYDLELRILSAQVSKPFQTERREGCVVITNQGGIETDILFKEEDVLAAIERYFDMKNGVASDGKSTRLMLTDQVARADPATAIERGDREAAGQKYRIDGNLSCLQMAVLATCWYAHSYCETINAVVGQAQAMNEAWQASRGGIFTF
ncbi:hypothetical protein KFZ76_07030 [Methylovulum psychrotolerans]|uniref:hypothetical protein n=1 Tax=Methylovulum psychrotolerans TaxID=1704499 RepID=UPI001BFF25A7|nr:hypothetical protein [Methylovulum psychrotolerans]MBT9097464.1 hypothetical protein [Methylovulum psychrotolerans]